MASGVTIINPLTLSRGSALETGPFAATGEVRHFSPDDAADPHAWSNPTRQLAQRDNLIGDKINEIIETVNNKEQYIDLPTVRTTLSPGVSEVITNYRIPAGFEARIFNAIVSATPTGGARLEIYHNAGSYGLSTGTNVVSTADEFSGGTTFWPTGEFVIKMFNDGTVTADVVSSIILTMRPVGPQAGGIIGPGAEGARGPKGDPGPQGAVGPQGPPGAAGTPGMIWEGTWNGSTTYTPGDVVRYQSVGAPGDASFISKLTGIGQPPPTYPTESNTYWEIVSQAGETGPAGPMGPVGSGVGIPGPMGSTGPVGPQGAQGIPGVNGFTYLGNWGVSGTYGVNSTVTYVSGSIYRTFWTNGSATVGVPPPSSPAWSELFGPSISPVISQVSASGSFTTSSDFVPGSTSTSYLGNSTLASGIQSVAQSYREFDMLTTTSGLATLRLNFGINFSGTITCHLPNGPGQDWTTSDVNVVAANHGGVGAITMRKIDTKNFIITSSAVTNIGVGVSGEKVIPAS